MGTAKDAKGRAAEALADAMVGVRFDRDDGFRTWRGRPAAPPDNGPPARSVTLPGVTVEVGRGRLRLSTDRLEVIADADGRVTARGVPRLGDVRLMMAALLRLAEGGRQ